MLPKMGALRFFHSWYSKGTLAVIDQAAYSLGSFLLNIFLARWLSPSDYGIFALGFALLLFFQGLQNALVLEPMSIVGPSRYHARIRRYLMAQLGLHSAVTVPVGLILVLVGVLVRLLNQGTTLSAVLITVGAVLPFHGLGWLGRRYFYILQCPVKSLWVSCTNLIFSMGLLLTLWFLGKIGPLTGLLILGFSGVVSGSLGTMMLSNFGRASRKERDALSYREILQEHWRIGRWLVLLVPLGLASQVVVFIPAATLGLAEAGALRALSNLVIPIQQTVVALSSLALPTLAAAFAREGLKRFTQKGSVMTVGLTGITLVYTIIIFWSAPLLESLLYGDKYHSFIWVVPFLAVDTTLTTWGTTKTLTLKAMERTDYAVLSGAVGSILILSLSAALTHRYGIGGLLGGMIVSRVVVLLMNIRLVRLALAKREVAH